MKSIDFHTDILPLKDKIFRLALRITLDRAEAEDITQETLVRMWQQRDEWHQIQNLEAYSLTVCRRLALDALKKKTGSKMYEERGERQEEEGVSPSPKNNTSNIPSPEPLPDEILDQKQRMAAVQLFIDQLPEVQRIIMLLRDIEGYRYDEIAQLTNLSETQVKVYLHRARTKIKAALTVSVM